MDQSSIMPPQVAGSRSVKSLKRGSLISLAVMSIALPLWLLFARQGGWGALSLTFLVAPSLFVGCWVLFVLRICRPDSLRHTVLSVIDAALLLGFYAAVFLRGLFLVDGKGARESYNSFANSHLGISLAQSQSLAATFNALSITLFVLCLVYFVTLFIVNFELKKRAAGATSSAR